MRAAVRLLQECSEIRNLKVSKLMETAPYGYTEQPAFLNGAIELETLFTPQELLVVIHKIEAELGRERVIHWGPRTIDLDIVFYDDEIVSESELIIPHIDMQTDCLCWNHSTCFARERSIRCCIRPLRSFVRN